MYFNKKSLKEIALLLMLATPSLFVIHELTANFSPGASRLTRFGVLGLVLLLVVAIRARQLARQAFRLREKQLTLQNLDTAIAPIVPTAPEDSGIAVH